MLAVLRTFFVWSKNMLEAVVENEKNKANDKNSGGFVNFIGAIGGITSGLILMLTGLFLSGISFFNRINFHGWDVILLVAAFVFLAIGSHYLDKIDAVKKVKRIESYKMRGLPDEKGK